MSPVRQPELTTSDSENNNSFKNRDYLVIALSLLFVLTTIVSVYSLLYDSSFDPRSHAGKPATKPNEPGQTEKPLAMEYIQKFGDFDYGCIGVDDTVYWKATGYLDPGESFTYTPPLPSCRGETPFMSAKAHWDGSELEIKTIVPYPDYCAWDPEQAGKEIVSTNMPGRAYICMFSHMPPSTSGQNPYYYSFIITNKGTERAKTIVFEGVHDNGWMTNYYHECNNADADKDGFNDSMEFGTNSMTYYVNNGSGHDMGFNYLRARGSSIPGDEVDFYPGDFNDDNKIDQSDITMMEPFMGQGNGVPLSMISPNPSQDTYLYKQTFAWRRYDLNLDGYVNDRDLSIVETLKGKSIPMEVDIVDPFGKVTHPEQETKLTKGANVLLGAYAWDNAAIDNVTFYTGSTELCSVKEANRQLQNVGLPIVGLYRCWWNVPKRKSNTYSIHAVVTDAHGRQFRTESVTYSVQ